MGIQYMGIEAVATDPSVFNLPASCVSKFSQNSLLLKYALTKLNKSFQIIYNIYFHHAKV